MGIPKKVLLPGKNVEFSGDPPPMDRPPPQDNIIEYKQYTYAEWLELLHNGATRKKLQIFVWGSDGTFNGFGAGARKVFRSIAHQLRSFHNASLHCGDLIKRISIRVPDLVVSFTHHPSSENNKAGILSDMTHFRFMVAMLMNDHLKKSASETEFINLPLDFKLFFSPTFFNLPIRHGSFLQFFHPIFFNGEDRIKFITLVTHYRKINQNEFDKRLQLDNQEHGLDAIIDWTKKIPVGVLREALLQSPAIDKRRDKYKYYSEIPNYMRNVYTHCMDNNKNRSLEDYDHMLNRIFPAICSRILDCVINNLDSSAFRDYELADILEQRGIGFYSENYIIDEDSRDSGSYVAYRGKSSGCGEASTSHRMSSGRGEASISRSGHGGASIGHGKSFVGPSRRENPK